MYFDTLAAARFHPGYVAGNWTPTIDATLAAGAGASANTIGLIPFMLPAPVTISDLGARVSTADVAPGHFQLAWYASDPATKLWTGLPVAQTGDISGGSSIDISAAIVGGNKALAPGLYWQGWNTDSATLALMTLAAASSHSTWLVGSPTLADMALSAANAALVRQLIGAAYNTWPDLTGQALTVSASQRSVVTFFKAA